MKHRVAIAATAFVGLTGVLVLMQKQRTDEYEAGATAEESPLPALVRDQVTAVEITRPGEAPVKLERRGDQFRVVSPVDYPADQSNVATMLDKLLELEFVSYASRSASSHAALEVDDGKGIRVAVTAGGRVVSDFRIGLYRGGKTMIRMQGSDDVLAVRGSIRYAFAREVREWRDRVVTDFASADVKSIDFASDAGTFRFERGAGGDYAPVGAAIPNFEASKVDGLVTALARLRATDFGAEADAASAAFATPRGTVTLHIETEATDAGPGTTQDVTLVLGGEKAPSNDVFVQRVGNPTLYVVSASMADRFRPAVAAFQAAADAGAPAPEPEPAMPEGGGMGEGQIPPEVLQQLLQQAGGAR